MEKPLREQIEKLNTLLPDQAYYFAVEDPKKIRLLEKNARYMAQDQFQTLVNNIKSDGALGSLPLCCKETDGALLALSGNHRVQAAVHAGLEQIIVLVARRDLSREEKVAIQLSHNAIAGKDDPVILKELWDEITDLGLKMYAGLDSECIKDLEKMEFVSISEAQPDFKCLALLFLPEEVSEIKKLMEDVGGLLVGDENLIASRKHYDEVFRLLIEVKDNYGIVNNPTAFMKIIELARTQIETLTIDPA